VIAFCVDELVKVPMAETVNQAVWKFTNGSQGCSSFSLTGNIFIELS
jgi:hypothetical protein